MQVVIQRDQRVEIRDILDVPHVAASEIQTTWEDAVSGALANTKPVKEALSEGSKALQAILDKYLARTDKIALAAIAKLERGKR